MKRIRVELGERSYPVWVGEGLLARSGEVLKQLGFSTPPVLISNARVLRLHGGALFQSLEGAFGRIHGVRVGDGERFKNYAELQRVYSGLFRARADRRSWVVAFGGGVVGDLAGFAAATFMRGIPYVNVPTTLLAQVDSSIGGKVGINVPQGKNLIGAFHQPSAVLSDTGVLKTLPRRELASGLYEVVKCGAVGSEKLLGYLERRLEAIIACETAALQHVVLEASRIKAEVVGGDETEKETRMVLNYGHTVGHALEAASEYRRFKHGEAVGWGMVAAVCYGRELGLLEPEEARRLVRLIHRVIDLPSLEGIPPARVWSALLRDKKFRSGRIKMVLLPRLGSYSIRGDIDPAHLRAFLRRFLLEKGRVSI